MVPCQISSTVDSRVNVDELIDAHNRLNCTSFNGPYSITNDLEDFFRRRNTKPVQAWTWLFIKHDLPGRGSGALTKCDIPKGAIVTDYYGYISSERDHEERLQRITDESVAEQVVNYRFFLRGRECEFLSVSQ
ncbi:unnamed protein product [Anisakis simplex]|uniref:SET domain-containing protein n=1 Tax=Anisakis simplex TaxID=6269 RepID=A0A0M3JJ93_ANISI|nr:unnamed protein product [Anisakis simplex]